MRKVKRTPRKYAFLTRFRVEESVTNFPRKMLLPSRSSLSKLTIPGDVRAEAGSRPINFIKGDEREREKERAA